MKQTNQERNDQLMKWVLEAACVEAGKGILIPVSEHKFHATRRWRFDYAWPEKYLAVEIEGGTWVGGRHTRGVGYEKDCEKYNTAVSLGWRVLRFTPTMLENDPIAAAHLINLMLDRL